MVDFAHVWNRRRLSPRASPQESSELGLLPDGEPSSLCRGRLLVGTGETGTWTNGYLVLLLPAVLGIMFACNCEVYASLDG